MNTIAITISTAVGITSLATFVASFLAYVRSSATKRYAAEQEFKEIRTELIDLRKSTENYLRTSDFQFQNILMKLSEMDGRIDSVTILKDPKY